jgi:predicted kinase
VSDTPKTDAASWREHQQSVVDAEFARELERDLARVTAERDDARRDACISEVRADILSHYNGHEPDEDEILTKARDLAVDRGWDCFKEVQP